LDSNAIDHLHKRIGCTDSDFQRLVAAKSSGKISIPMSLTVVEEVASAVERDPALAKAQLQLLWRICDCGQIVKPIDMLLTDDLRHYALHGRPTTPIFTGEEQAGLLIPLRQLLLEFEKNAEVNEILAIARKQKEQFRNGMQHSQKDARDLARELRKRAPNLSFCEYWLSAAEHAAEAFAARVQVLKECRARGIDRLLELKSVRMAVGMSLSLVYALTFENRTPKYSDSRDIHHATLAAACADVFVSDDAKLMRLAGRVPFQHFTAVSLQDFLHGLAPSP
jgi:hypothetical protein